MKMENEKDALSVTVKTFKLLTCEIEFDLYLL